MKVGLSPGDFVLDGDPVPFPKKGRSPLPIFPHFYCGQTARCIKMPLGMDVGLSPGDCVRWGPRGFHEFGLKTPIQVPKIGVLADLTPKYGTISS